MRGNPLRACPRQGDCRKQRQHGAGGHQIGRRQRRVVALGAQRGPGIAQAIETGEHTGVGRPDPADRPAILLDAHGDAIRRDCRQGQQAKHAPAQQPAQPRPERRGFLAVLPGCIDQLDPQQRERDEAASRERDGLQVQRQPGGQRDGKGDADQGHQRQQPRVERKPGPLQHLRQLRAPPHAHQACGQDHRPQRDLEGQGGDDVLHDGDADHAEHRARRPQQQAYRQRQAAGHPQMHGVAPGGSKNRGIVPLGLSEVQRLDQRQHEKGCDAGHE
ncbi:hypothetical protein D3C86_821830 [compost metagenome]